MKSTGKRRKPSQTVLLVFGFTIILAMMPTVQTGAIAQSESSPNLQKRIADFTPKGMRIFDKVKRFTPENLYEQINGRAEYFLAYDMVEMTHASFINNVDAGKFIDLSIYDMGTPTNAFGVFSTERSKGDAALELGRASFREESNYYIWKGQYYIKVIASDVTDDLKQLGMELAQKVTDLVHDSGGQVWGFNSLPKKDRVAGTVQYYKYFARGLDFMTNVYAAKYLKYNTLVTVFLSKQGSFKSAKSVLDAYTMYAKRYGNGIEYLKAGDVELISCDMGEKYDVIFQKGLLVGGVLSVEDQSLAVKVASELEGQLRQK